MVPSGCLVILFGDAFWKSIHFLTEYVNGSKDIGVENIAHDEEVCRFTFIGKTLANLVNSNGEIRPFVEEVLNPQNPLRVGPSRRQLGW